MPNTPEPPDNPIYQQRARESLEAQKPLSVEPGTLVWLLEVMPGPEWFDRQMDACEWGRRVRTTNGSVMALHIHGNLLQYLQAKKGGEGG